MSWFYICETAHKLKLKTFVPMLGDFSVVCAHVNGESSFTDGKTKLRMRETNKFRSYSNNCCMKFIFGEIISRLVRTYSKAWSSVRDL